MLLCWHREAAEESAPKNYLLASIHQSAVRISNLKLTFICSHNLPCGAAFKTLIDKQVCSSRFNFFKWQKSWYNK